jgi:uncharacterized protein (TIGR02246 family)
MPNAGAAMTARRTTFHEEELEMHDLVIADVQIRQLHARYADAVWRKDAECFGALFADDAEWKVAGMHLVGRTEIQATFAKFMVHVERTLMRFATPVITLGDDGVSSRTQTVENNRFADGRTASTIGIYYERFVVQGGVWRFRWRHWNLHYIGPPDFSGSLYDVLEYGPPPGFPGPNAPTTVRKDFLFTGQDGAPAARP